MEIGYNEYMKKLLTLLVIIAVIVGGYYLWQKRLAPSTAVNTLADDGTSFRPDASSATFTFDDESVTLSKGRSETSDSAIGLVIETELLEERAYGDLNGDGKDDTVVLLSRSTGGSGVFIYAAAYISGPVSYKGTDAVFIGDRISPQSISVSGGIATVNYLDRGPDEPFAAEPTIPTSKQFLYKNGNFQAR